MSIFNSIPVKKLKRTPHNLSHPVKFSCQFGQEQPTMCEKVIPGDTAIFQHAHRVDFAPLATKLMQEFRIKQETFFVPTRILWKDFEEFFVAEDNSIVHPYIDFHRLAALSWSLDWIDAFESYPAVDYGLVLTGPKSLFYALYGDVLDLGSNKSANGTDTCLDALRWYAYMRVFAEYYLDENLQSDIIDFLDVDNFKASYQVNSGDMTDYVITFYTRYLAFCYGIGFDTVEVINEFPAEDNPLLAFYARGFLFRNYPKDYFTGSLPWKQKGNAVMIPQSQAEVQFFVQNDASTSDDILSAEAHYIAFQNNTTTPPSGYKGVNLVGREIDAANHNTYIKGLTGIGGGVTSIEDFRTAYQLQQWLEKNARGGTRYKEQILSHFGVKTKDSRLDRPEFLLGTTDVVSHGDVYTTYQDEQGNGVPAESVTRLQAAGRSRRVGYHVTEHGYLISVFCIFPKANYAQGVFRQAFELDKFDYFWPEFEHLGEQEVFRGEVNSKAANPKSVFGYVPRYAQYKSRLPVVRGEFVGSLETFTLYRQIDDSAALNGNFIMIDPVRNNLNRCFNVVTEGYDKVYPEVYNNLVLYRPMSYYGTPRLVL